MGWGHTLLKFFGDRKIEESEGCDRRLLTVKVEACCLVLFSAHVSSVSLAQRTSATNGNHAKDALQLQSGFKDLQRFSG